MAGMIPLKVRRVLGDTDSLGEFEPTDSVPVDMGGTGGNTSAEAITNLGLLSATSINNSLSGKAPTIHTHLESDISDLDKYTQAQVDQAILNANVVTLSTINGNLIPTFIDSTRANKILSVSDLPFTFSERSSGANGWMDIGRSNAGRTAFTMPMDGTVVGWIADIGKTSLADRDYNLYRTTSNNVSDLLFTTTGDTNTHEFGSLNFDFAQGDYLRVRGGAQSVGVNVNDITVVLIVRWRG